MSPKKLQNLDDNKILIQKVQFLLIVFDGDVFFKLPSLPPNAHNSSQMQSMDKKYDDHVWCTVITNNIKNNFGLNFKKARCLGHLRCVHDDYENFVHFDFRNECFYSGKCIHIPIIG